MRAHNTTHKLYTKVKCKETRQKDKKKNEKGRRQEATRKIIFIRKSWEYESQPSSHKIKNKKKGRW